MAFDIFVRNDGLAFIAHELGFSIVADIDNQTPTTIRPE
jgi:hypothetical protein